MAFWHQRIPSLVKDPVFWPACLLVLFPPGATVFLFASGQHFRWLIPPEESSDPVHCHFIFSSFLRDCHQPETGLGQCAQGIAVTSNRRNQDHSRTEASTRVGSLLIKQPHYSLLPKKGQPQSYSQIVTASTPYKDAQCAQRYGALM